MQEFRWIVHGWMETLQICFKSINNCSAVMMVILYRRQLGGVAINEWKIGIHIS